MLSQSSPPLNTSSAVPSGQGGSTPVTSIPSGTPVEYEGDLAILKARLLANGANEQVVELCDSIFNNGVTIEALEKQMTREQCNGLGIRHGKQFRLFLQSVGEANDWLNGLYRCCLCSPDKGSWDNHHALRHLLKDHFGLSFQCEQWLVSLMTRDLMLTKLHSTYRCFTRWELTKHINIKHAVLTHKGRGSSIKVGVVTSGEEGAPRYRKTESA